MDDTTLTAAITASSWDRMAAQAACHEADLELVMAALTAAPWHRLRATCTEVVLNGAVDVAVAS